MLQAAVDYSEQEFLYSSSFDVREDSSVKDAVSSDQLDSPCTDQVLEDWPITEEIFQELIPFYLAFDNNLTVYAAGPVIERFRPSLVHKTLEDFFLPVSYTKLSTFEAITLARFKPYTMRCRCGADYCRITFEGRAIINSDDPSMAVYNCTPTVFTFECLKRTRLSVSDFCYNADNQDRIFLSMHLYTAKIVRENLEATECLLKENYEKIDAQKKKSLDVLYSVLPSFAADKYLQSEDFPPTRFNSLSVLFSDIKGFAQICQNSSPVSTVIMLNNLFNKYDDLTDMHDVLKLENYGDTYIVTGAGRHRSDHPIHS
ncbi:guanylate cyclase soluble subunit alpha-2-like [Dysidea avara]|uniref:guanylate cyclase soluble subunit alpha-2-like n=1 Tax=Dysidea avara TaxID=196820 RepID=UPI003333CFE0